MNSSYSHQFENTGDESKIEHEIMLAAQNYAKALAHLEHMHNEQQQIQKACAEADSLVAQSRGMLLRIIEETTVGRSDEIQQRTLR